MQSGEVRTVTILFLTPYYPPETGAPQTRIYELAIRLQGLGHQVLVLTTFPNYPSGVVPSEWRGKLFWRGTEQGIQLYRVWSYATPNKGFYKRIFSQLSFAIFASLAGIFLPRFDALVVESPPLFDGFAGLVLSRLKKAPYVFNVADLWPDTAVQLGMLRNPRLISLAKRFELLLYRRAALVLAVTRGICDAICRDGIEASKVILFRNAVDTQFFSPTKKDSELRQRFGLAADQFVLLYAGTLGLAQQLNSVIEAAAMFQNEGNHRLVFAFAGDGAERQSLEAKARDLKLGNVKFLGSHPKQRMPYLLNMADAVLVSLRDVPIFDHALPTKMFEAMSCEKPVLLAGKGEAEEVLMEAHAGWCARPGDALSIHDAVIRMVADPEMIRVRGLHGRQYVSVNFDRNQRAEQLSGMLRRLTRGRRAATETGAGISTEPTQRLESTSMGPSKHSST